MHRTRRLTALLASAALVAGGAIALAGPASAVPLGQVQDLESLGLNYGYEMDWSAPQDTTGLVSYTAAVYLATDLTFTTPVKSMLIDPNDWDREYVEADFSGLVAGTKYVGTVVADYTGDTHSAPAAADQAQAYKPVAAVTSLVVTPGSHKLTATWKAPKITQPALTGTLKGYIVLAQSGPLAFPEAFEFPGATATKVTLTGLENGTTYTVTVAPFAGDYGPDATKKARPVGTPAKPKDLKVTFKSHGKTKLSWKAPASPAKAPVTGYAVYVNGKLVKKLTGKKTTHLTVKHQKHHKKYKYSVRATNLGPTKSHSLSKTITRP